MTFAEVKQLATTLTEDQKTGVLCEILDEGLVDLDAPIDTLREYVDDSIKRIEKVQEKMVELEAEQAEDAPE